MIIRSAITGALGMGAGFVLVGFYLGTFSPSGVTSAMIGLFGGAGVAWAAGIRHPATIVIVALMWTLGAMALLPNGPLVAWLFLELSGETVGLLIRLVLWGMVCGFAVGLPYRDWKAKTDLILAGGIGFAAGFSIQSALFSALLPSFAIGGGSWAMAYVISGAVGGGIAGGILGGVAGRTYAALVQDRAPWQEGDQPAP